MQLDAVVARYVAVVGAAGSETGAVGCSSEAAEDAVVGAAPHLKRSIEILTCAILTSLILHHGCIIRNIQLQNTEITDYIPMNNATNSDPVILLVMNIINTISTFTYTNPLVNRST